MWLLFMHFDMQMWMCVMFGWLNFIWNMMWLCVMFSWQDVIVCYIWLGWLYFIWSVMWLCVIFGLTDSISSEMWCDHLMKDTNTIATKHSVHLIWNANAHKEPKSVFQTYPKSKSCKSWVFVWSILGHFVHFKLLKWKECTKQKIE